MAAYWGIAAYSADMFSYKKYLIVNFVFPTSVFGERISFCLRHFLIIVYFYFSKFYRRYYELIFKFHVVLKTLLREGLSEPKFYGVLVYKKKLIGRNVFFFFVFSLEKILIRYKRIGYNLNVMRQAVCLVFNPIMIDNYASLL